MPIEVVWSWKTLSFSRPSDWHIPWTTYASHWCLPFGPMLASMAQWNNYASLHFSFLDAATMTPFPPFFDNIPINKHTGELTQAASKGEFLCWCVEGCRVTRTKPEQNKTAWNPDTLAPQTQEATWLPDSPAFPFWIKSQTVGREVFPADLSPLPIQGVDQVMGNTSSLPNADTWAQCPGRWQRPSKVSKFDS